MGEIAEAVLEGTLCEGCGVFLNAVAPGYPCYCRDCRPAAKQGAAAERKEQRAIAHQQHQARQKKTKCPTCGRKVKEIGLANHMKDAHQ